MTKRISLLLAVLLALLPALAMADATLESSAVLARSAYLSEATNCYYTRTDAGYQLFDAAGNAISAVYGDISARQDGMYYEVRNENGLNAVGLLDASGKELLPLTYGDFEYLSNDWVLAYVLEATDADTGEYKDSDGNKYNAGRTDVLYKGQLIGSMNRDQYIKSYTTTARGAFLCVKTSSTTAYWLDSAFNRTDVTDDSYVSTSEYQDIYKKGVLHNATQQYAFTSTCTLTPDQVEQSVWYDDATDSLLDLQGNVIASDLHYDTVRFVDNAFLVRRNSLYGVLSLDGREIAAPIYDEISYDYDTGLFSSGYTAAVDEKGRLSYFDQTGAVTASVDYELSSSDYKGFTYNAPIVAVNNMGKYIIITATHGELPDKYSDFSTCRTAQPIISVMKDDAWGCIDMAGNVVIPFVHRTSLDISADGTLVAGTTLDREYVIYRVSYDVVAPAESATPEESATPAEPAAPAEGWICASCAAANTGKFCMECGAAKPAEETALAEGEWVCPSCQTVSGSKFCPECGTAKPAEAKPVVCSGCGYDPGENVPKFCPECGTKF